MERADAAPAPHDCVVCLDPIPAPAGEANAECGSSGCKGASVVCQRCFRQIGKCVYCRRSVRDSGAKGAPDLTDDQVLVLRIAIGVTAGASAFTLLVMMCNGALRLD